MWHVSSLSRIQNAEWNKKITEHIEYEFMKEHGSETELRVIKLADLPWVFLNSIPIRT